MRGTVQGWGTAILGIGVTVALASLLSGCVPGAPAPVPTGDPSTSAAAGDPSPTPTLSRELNLQGTASDNLPYFDDVNLAWINGGGATDGRSLIDNLVDAGFPKETMEVTPDRTTVNAAADQVQFSVRINGTCLIGQFGGGSYNGTAQTMLADNRCLIGATRPIDW